ncbi:MAG: alpha/beta hydrolase, partial [Chloroflexota bacterium]
TTQFFVNEAGERLAYQTYGDQSAPPVVLVHGWTSFMGVWETTIPLLKDDYFVVTLDLLGHGRSAKPHNADYSIEAQARRVLALADMLGLARFALIGHSMGGQTALTIASVLAPERVTLLVSVSGVVTGALQPVPKLVHQLFRFGRFIAFAAPIFSPFRANAYTANLLYGQTWFYDLHSLPRDVWHGLSKWLIDPPSVTPYWKAGNAIMEWDLTPHLSAITAPTLVMFGQADATVPVSEIDAMRPHSPHLTIATYDACGHFPMFEQVDQYATDLLEFLKVHAQTPVPIPQS